MGAPAQKLQDFQQQRNPGSKMIPVHLQREEVRYMNAMQGGQFIDPKTELREYSRLWQVIQQPQMKELFLKLTNYFHTEGKVPPHLDALAKKESKKLPPFKAIPSDRNPKVQIIEAMGTIPGYHTDQDKVLGMMPKAMAEFFDKINGRETDDPVLGLQQFGNSLPNPIKEIGRVVATVGGFMLGGPAGAGIGNALGQVATGRSIGRSLKEGAMAGLGTWGASMIPGVGGAMTSGASSLAGALGMGGMGWAGSPAAMAGAGGAAAAAAAAPAAAATAASAAAPAAKVATGFGKYLTPEYLLPVGAIGAGLMMSAKGQRDQQKQQDRIHEEQKQKVGNVLESGGFNDHLSGSGLRRHKVHHDYRPAYKTGGILAVKGEPIKGRGRGQEDLIPRDNIKEGGWIWHATNVAHLGDGATDAGQKHIEQFEKQIKKHMLKPLAKQIMQQDKEVKPRKVLCALSNGERHTPRVIVTALGKGSNSKGASILRKMNDEIALHKISKGKKLPPAAHDLMTYYKMVI